MKKESSSMKKARSPRVWCPTKGLRRMLRLSGQCWPRKPAALKIPGVCWEHVNLHIHWMLLKVMPANWGYPVIHTDDVSRREPSLVDSPLASTLNPATQRFTQPCPIRFVGMTGACVCTRSKFSSKILVHSWTWSGPPHGSHVTCKSSRMPISRFSFLRDLPIGLGRH